MAIQSCDLLLCIGARLDLSVVAFEYNKFATQAVKIMVDIDQGEALKVLVLDKFIHMDAVEFATKLKDVKWLPGYSEWAGQCLMWKQDKLEGKTASYDFMYQLGEALPDDAILIAGSSCMAVNLFCADFHNKKGQRFILSSCGLGSMGATIPVSIGVALSSCKRVFVFDGDGSFMQNIQELEVVKRLSLDITYFVLNNSGYASIRNSELRAFNRLAGGNVESGLTLPNVRIVARAFGLYACDFFPFDMDDYIFHWRGPKVIELTVPTDEELIPRVITDGTGDLERMYPHE
jgi:acetolactate synthase-1/2/3 large subunit